MFQIKTTESCKRVSDFLLLIENNEKEYSLEGLDINENIQKTNIISDISCLTLRYALN